MESAVQKSIIDFSLKCRGLDYAKRTELSFYTMGLILQHNEQAIHRTRELNSQRYSILIEDEAVLDLFNGPNLIVKRERTSLLVTLDRSNENKDTRILTLDDLGQFKDYFIMPAQKHLYYENQENEIRIYMKNDGEWQSDYWFTIKKDKSSKIFHVPAIKHSN